MAATTDSNENYKRYTETPGVEAAPQPAFELVSDEPGSTWETKPYRNYNGDYVARDEDGNARTVQPYVARDEDGNPRTVQPYVKTDS